MNRDEKLTRAPGLPPTKKKLNGHVVVCPSELGGGTWVALNDSGVCLALINWYAVRRNVTLDPLSRGGVVKTVCASDSYEVVETKLHALPLERINPFRLIGIFPGIKEIVEWRWNLKRLVRKKCPWKSQQWISSGFDEPTAQRVRGRAFLGAFKGHSINRLNWLRRLHGSHCPQPGPFSTCMHRTDAATVSYTEVAVSRQSANMRHHTGPPCCLLGRLKGRSFANGIPKLGMRISTTIHGQKR
jgi:hypothetical protein